MEGCEGDGAEAAAEQGGRLGGGTPELTEGSGPRSLPRSHPENGMSGGAGVDGDESEPSPSSTSSVESAAAAAAEAAASASAAAHAAAAPPIMVEDSAVFAHAAPGDAAAADGLPWESAEELRRFQLELMCGSTPLSEIPTFPRSHSRRHSCLSRLHPVQPFCLPCAARLRRFLTQLSGNSMDRSCSLLCPQGCRQSALRGPPEVSGRRKQPPAPAAVVRPSFVRPVRGPLSCVPRRSTGQRLSPHRVPPYRVGRLRRSGRIVPGFVRRRCAARRRRAGWRRRGRL